MKPRSFQGRWLTMAKYPSLKMNTAEVNNLILQSLVNAGTMCSVETLAENIMTKREKIINEHLEHRSIWQNKTTGKWCTKLGEEKRLIARKERSDLENAIIEFYLSPQANAMTVEEVFNDFCNYCRNHNTVTAKTITEYENEFKKYIAPLSLAGISIGKVDELLLIESLKTIVEKIKLTQKRYSNVKTVIKRIFLHAKAELHLNCIAVKNIIDELKFPSAYFVKVTRDDELEVFKLSEIQKIKNHLANSTDLEELAILLDIETGLRLGELVTLQRSDVFQKHLKICHSEHKEKTDDGYVYYVGLPKKDKIANVQLSAEAIRLLERIISLSDSKFLFPSKKDANTWNRSYNIDKAIRRVCRELDIPVRSMQKIRRTYASILLQEKKLSTKAVQMQLRHSDETTTLRHYSYNIYDEDELEDTFLNIAI